MVLIFKQKEESYKNVSWRAKGAEQWQNTWLDCMKPQVSFPTP